MSFEDQQNPPLGEGEHETKPGVEVTAPANPEATQSESTAPNQNDASGSAVQSAPAPALTETSHDPVAYMQSQISQMTPEQAAQAMSQLVETFGAAVQQSQEMAAVAQQPQVPIPPVAPQASVTSFAELQAQSMAPQQEFDALVAHKEYLWLRIGGLSLYHMTDEWKEIEQLDERLNILWNNGKSGIVRKEDKR